LHLKKGGAFSSAGLFENLEATFDALSILDKCRADFDNHRTPAFWAFVWQQLRQYITPIEKRLGLFLVSFEIVLEFREMGYVFSVFLQ